MTPTMRIVIATDIYLPIVSGSTNFTRRLAINLAQRGHTVSLLTWSKRFRAERYEDEGVTVIGLPSIPIFIHKCRVASPLFLRSRMKRLFNELRPDAVHIQDHFFIGAAALDIAHHRNIPVVATNHFMPENLTHYLHLSSAIERLVNRIAWSHFRRVYAQADAVLTPTKTAAHLLTSIGFSKKVDVMSCGIDVHRFQPGPKPDALRSTYSLPAKPVLLYVGRLDKEKNIDVLLRAYAQALQKGLIAHFLIVGKGVVEDKLHALSHELALEKHVTFAGFVPDDLLPQTYRLGDCFAIASIAELQSIATLEAMASGLPVLAANVMALPELVEEGKNGYTFDPTDIDALSNRMIEMLSDPAQRVAMGKHSRVIAQRHAIEETVSAHERLYEALISQKQELGE